MHKKPCPYHQGLVKHTLKECTMLRRYYAKLRLPNNDAKKGAQATLTTTRMMGSPRCTMPS